ncbi:MAG: ABC transporter substrate-binding protein [Methylobacterium sp.]|nr:ABC transporter substrate-binding protein [Methylobacterium sp.]MCA3651138.1 ABC transporter substrate-binding protein [Methylobacterium sp.]MCA4924026.1 ABC transporter substrate-binding protein [Methylobacterium sp.]
MKSIAPVGRGKVFACLFLAVLAWLVGPVFARAQAPVQPPPAAPQSILRLFIGNAQKLDVARLAIEGYLRANPGIGIEIETGGATLEQQQQMLNAALTSKDSGYDLFLIDVLRPAQWAAAQWAEPLDAHLGAERDRLLDRYPPGMRAASIHAGRVMALPYFADAQFLYYRKDLLEKYALEPPLSWDELKAAAQKIMAGENNPALIGLQSAGAPVESTVCSYLVPLWATGEDLLAGGRPNLGSEAAKRPFQLWADLRAANVTPPNHAEIATDRIRQTMQAGNLIFGITWSYAWNRLETDADSAVKGRIGIAPMPGFEAGRSASCLGGWMVAVSAFSRNKPMAAKFARHLSSPETARVLALQAGHLPVFAELYADPEVLAARPWFAQALPVVQSARPRPITPRYSEVSEVLRANVHAVLGGSKTTEQALSDMGIRLGGIFR